MILHLADRSLSWCSDDDEEFVVDNDKSTPLDDSVQFLMAYGWIELENVEGGFGNENLGS